MISSLLAFLQTSGLLPVLDRGQALIAGLLSLLAGLVAFVGVLIGACLQVRAMRRAAAAQIAAMRQTTADQVTTMRQAAMDQVAAIQAQIADLQHEREEIDRRRRQIIKWAVRVEGEQLEQAAKRARCMAEEVIDVDSPLFRGGREDVALLDDETIASLQKVDAVVKKYNAIPGQMKASNGAPLIEELEKLAAKLRELP